jgi:PhnB protein
MTSTNPYLHFAGNTETAMTFYQTVFGGTFTIFQRYKDFPGGERMSRDEQDKIMHISLAIGYGIVIMATDALESMGRQVNLGNNVYICLQAESVEEVNRLFGELAVGGEVEMPLNETFWGAYFGMCRDKFGIHWMMNYTKSKN